MTNPPYDVVIIGGGLMGCSTAYNLIKRDESLSVAVVEMDPTYEKASSCLSLANVRTNFSVKENIQISQYAMKVIKTFEEDMQVNGEKPFISWRQEGNLFLYEDEGVQDARSSYVLQKSLGCAVEWLSPDDIKAQYPLYNLDGIAAGSFGHNDGHLDGYTFLRAYKTKSRSMGVKYITGEVSAVLSSGGKVNGIKLSTGDTLLSDIVVNCSGAWAAKIAATSGVELPIEPTNKQVFCVDTKVKPDGPLPLSVWPSGIIFRTETGNQIILVGDSPEGDPIGFDFTWNEKKFTDILWPQLAEVVPVFETLKLMRGWAGLYAVNTFDWNALLGEWPELKGFYLANGFSGHGLQQSPAVGRYISELILNQPPKLDLSIFNPIRLFENKPIVELGCL